MNSKMITYELASLLEAQGYHEKAGEYYRLLLEKEPDRADIAASLKRLESLSLEEGHDKQEQSLSELFETWAALLLLKRKVTALNHFRGSIPLP